MEKITVKINGQNTELETEEGKISVADLAKVRDLKGFFAIELNLKIINKEDYAATFIKEGDDIEIVGFAGGG